MNYFTKEQLEEIKNLDDGKMEFHFTCVTQSNFKRGTSAAVDTRLYEIYKSATGEQLVANGCKSCQFRNYGKVAQLYYESKKHWEEEENAGNEIVDMIENMANLEKEVVNKSSKNNKPKGRPKKRQ